MMRIYYMQPELQRYDDELHCMHNIIAQHYRGKLQRENVNEFYTECSFESRR